MATSKLKRTPGMIKRIAELADFGPCYAFETDGLGHHLFMDDAGVPSLLSATDARTGQIHESFHADDPTIFTRDWFAWANSLFAQFILALANTEEGRRILGA